MQNARMGLLPGLVFLFLGVVGWSYPASAAPPEWIRIQSPHFELFTTAGTWSGRDAIIQFERIRYFFLAVTKSKAPHERVTIIAFNSTKEFAPYRPNEFSSAFYRTGHDREYIVMGRLNDEARGIAAHEYVHLLIKHSGIEMPLWLNEGLAEFYSTLTPVGKRVRVGDVPVSRLAYLRQKKLVLLEELTAADRGSSHYNEKDRAGVFYAQSWALTHMVTLSDAYREGSSRFVMELANGLPASEAFQRVYGKSLDQVQKDLSLYIRGDAFRAATYDITLERPDDIEAMPAGGLETGLLLGDLLAGKNKNQAREKYEETMQAYPEAPSVREALGYLSLREGNREQAKRLFADAVKLNTSNAKLCFDYAMLLRQDGVPNSKVIPLLERAGQLDTDFQEVHLYLGYLLVDEQQFEKALAVFARLKSVTREQAVRLYRAQSYAFYKTGNNDEAEKALELAKKHAESPIEIDSVAKLEGLLRWQGPEPRDFAPAATSLDRGDPDRPRITRPADPSAATGEAEPVSVRLDIPTTVTVSGTMEHFDCAGAKAKMKIAVGEAFKSLAIADPAEIVITGVDAGLFEFTCGPQNSRPLTIEYEPKQDTEMGTIGEIRVIHLE